MTQVYAIQLRMAEFYLALLVSGPRIVDAGSLSRLTSTLEPSLVSLVTPVLSPPF